jgi:hypothetical protein
MKFHRTAAFSLIEIMVSMTLLAVIVVGLLVVFNHTSRALRAVNNTTDVAEGARATVNFVTKDFGAMAAASLDTTPNLTAYSYSPPIILPMPGGGSQTNVLHDVFFLTHENDRWSAVGYFLDRNPRTGIGTLYRFYSETNWPTPDTNWVINFQNATIYSNEVRRIADGVVQFELSTYDAKGRVYLPGTVINTNTGILRVDDNGAIFTKQFLPAHVQLEIGIMEPETVRKYNALAAAASGAGDAYLQGQVGKIHLFRQRIAIRNHSEPPPIEP